MTLAATKVMPICYRPPDVTVKIETAMPLGQDDGFKSQHQTDFVGEQISELAKVVSTLLLPQSSFFPQCHYYPSDSAGKSEQNKLLSKKDFKFGLGSTLILGELATKIEAPSGKSPWGSDIPGNDSVTSRLEVAKSKGYDWAFPWSATNGIDGRSRFDKPTQDQYKMFLG